jgi:excisionase family DNA binding protein
MSLSQLYTAEQAAERLEVPASWLAREARAERVPHVRLGRYVRFNPEALEEWLATRACGPRTGSVPVPQRRRSR